MPDEMEGLAAGLMAEPPMPPLEGEPEENLAFEDAARDVFDALKSDDYESFKLALQDAISIAQNTGGL